MEMEKSKVLIQLLLIFRQSGDVLFFLYARRLRGYTATTSVSLRSAMVVNLCKFGSNCFSPFLVGPFLIKNHDQI